MVRGTSHKLIWEGTQVSLRGRHVCWRKQKCRGDWSVDSWRQTSRWGSVPVFTRRRTVESPGPSSHGEQIHCCVSSDNLHHPGGSTKNPHPLYPLHRAGGRWPLHNLHFSSYPHQPSDRTVSAGGPTAPGATVPRAAWGQKEVE